MLSKNLGSFFFFSLFIVSLQTKDWRSERELLLLLLLPAATAGHCTSSIRCIVSYSIPRARHQKQKHFSQNCTTFLVLTLPLLVCGRHLVIDNMLVLDDITCGLTIYFCLCVCVIQDFRGIACSGGCSPYPPFV